MLDLDKILASVPCPDCGSLETEYYDGTEYGNAFICSSCAEDFVLTPAGAIERYGKNPDYVKE